MKGYLLYVLALILLGIAVKRMVSDARNEGMVEGAKKASLQWVRSLSDTDD